VMAHAGKWSSALNCSQCCNTESSTLHLPLNCSQHPMALASTPKHASTEYTFPAQSLAYVTANQTVHNYRSSTTTNFEGTLAHDPGPINQSTLSAGPCVGAQTAHQTPCTLYTGLPGS
jgi:hypothetical protein